MGGPSDISSPWRQPLTPPSPRKNGARERESGACLTVRPSKHKGHGSRRALSHSSRCISAINLEQTRAALATADAHGHDAPLGLAALAFLEQMAGETRAGHAEGMADRDRAAVDIVLLGI